MKVLFQILSNIELHDKISDELAPLLCSHHDKRHPCLHSKHSPENFDASYAVSFVQTTITVIKWTFQLWPKLIVQGKGENRNAEMYATSFHRTEHNCNINYTSDSERLVEAMDQS
jgi:hypothetical protein